MKFWPFQLAVDAICSRDKRYDPRAYLFLKEALDFTLKRAADSNGGEARHVRGGELCEGFRDLAIQEFGPTARARMTEWGLHATSDIGEMVFHLIEEEILGRQDSDTREDFAHVYDFDDALGQPEGPSKEGPSGKEQPL